MDMTHLSQIERAVTGVSDDAAAYRPAVQRHVDGHVADMTAAFEREFPHVVLALIPGDIAERCRMRDDPVPGWQITRDQLRSGGVPKARAERNAGAVWNRINAAYGLASTTMAPDDQGPPDAIIRLPSTHVAGRTTEMQHVTDHLALCGVTPAGDAIARETETVGAIAHFHHELGHVVADAMYARPCEPTRRSNWIDEAIADVFAIMATAKRVGRWRAALADAVDMRSEFGVLHGDVEHWTVPALRRTAEMLEGDTAFLAHADLRKIADIARRIAMESAPPEGVLDALDARRAHDAMCAPSSHAGVPKREAWRDAMLHAYRRTRVTRVETERAFDPSRWIARAKAWNPRDRHDLLALGHAEREISNLARLGLYLPLSPVDAADAAGFLAQMILSMSDRDTSWLRPVLTAIETAADTADTLSTFVMDAGGALRELDDAAGETSDLLLAARRNLHRVVQSVETPAEMPGSTCMETRVAAAA